MAPESDASADVGDPLGAADPLLALGADRAGARSAGDANADLCWLATVDSDGTPRVRTLVLREVDGRFGLFVNATSPKWRQMDAEPRIQISCWFPALQRQWRVSGRIRPFDHEVVSRHWHRRPRVSQVLDHLYAQRLDQSSALAEDADLDAIMAELDASLPEVPQVPTQSLALELLANDVECMQIRRAPQLHLRQRWQRIGDDGVWQRIRLVP